MSKTQQQIQVRPPVMATKQAIINRLFELETKGATFVEFQTKTIPTMRKTNNPFIGKIAKLTRVNGQLNWDYANAVNKQRIREGIVSDDFTPQPRQWGQHSNNPITNKVSRIMVEHTPKGSDELKYYVQLRPLNVHNVQYVWTESGQELTEIELQFLQTFFPVRKPSETQQTEKEIRISDYAIDSIKTITVNKTVYIITG